MRANNKQEQLKADYQAVLKTTAGKRLIGRFLNLSHLYVTTWAPDPQAAAFNEGERSLGLTIVNELNKYVPGGFIEILKIMEEKNGRCN